MPWTIYCHTLIADGRKYVGQTSKTMQQRWNGHCRSATLKGSRFYFANAIRHYGPKAFAHEVLQVCETQEEANVAEDAWIERLGTRDKARGFNRKAGGKQGPHFITRNPWDRPEHRQKVVAAINEPEARRKMSEASREWAQSPEGRAKNAAKLKKMWADPSFKAKMSVIQGEAQKKSRAEHPEVTARIHASRKVTMDARRETRTHFDCKVHGQIPLTDCYSKISSATGLRVYECKVCVLAVQKAKRDEYRAANPLVPKTTFSCKVHGEIPRDQCFATKRKDSPITYRCKVCNLAQQKAYREAKKAPASSPDAPDDESTVVPRAPSG